MVEITQHTVKNSRHYTVTGDDRVPESTKLPSVTTVLGVLNKPWLLPWYKKLVADQIELAPALSKEQTIEIVKKADDLVRDNAADIGTEAHKLIQSYLQTSEQPQPNLNAPAVIAFYAFREWQEQSGISINLQEQSVYHPYLHYAGTIDAIGQDKEGKLVLLDWKSGGKSVYNETAVQLSAYAVAWGAQTDSDWRETQAICVRIDKETGKFEAKEVRDIWVEFNYFTHLLAVYNQRNRKVWR